MKAADLKLATSVRKAIISALGERGAAAEVVRDARANPEPDADLREYESVPLKEDIHTYFDREVKPHAPDSWVDESKTRIGYEIPLTRYFFQYQTQRPLSEIEAEIRQLEGEIERLLAE